MSIYDKIKHYSALFPLASSLVFLIWYGAGAPLWKLSALLFAAAIDYLTYTRKYGAALFVLVLFSFALTIYFFSF